MENMTNTTTCGVTMDCVTEASSGNATLGLSETISSWLTFYSSSVSLFMYCLVIISFIGIVANGILAFLLIMSNRFSASTPNVLIASQCLIDTFYSLGGFLYSIVKLGGLDHYSQPPTMLNTVFCVLLDSGTVVSVFQNSSIVGLIAITLERYWKVVYPIGHRKYYRPWMTRVTIGVTWSSGFVTFLLPSALTTRILNDACYITAVWPSAVASKVYALFQFAWNYVLPIIIFASCYRRILLTVRRQIKVTSVPMGVEPTPGDAGDNDNNRRTLQVPLNNSANLTRTELNITVTMISVTACYSILMLPTYVLYLREVIFQVFIDFTSPLQLFLIGLHFINPIVNPCIYVVRYHDVRRTWHAMTRQTITDRESI